MDRATLNTTMGTSSLYILLALLDHPLHAYGIRDQVAHLSGSRLIMAAGTPYVLLKGLIRNGLVERIDESTIYRKQVVYGLTPAGRHRLTNEYRRLRWLVSYLDQKLA